MPAVFFYISGHGFGHAARQVAIVNALGAALPGAEIVVRTSAPAWFFERSARVPLVLVPGECDTGVVQIDSLRPDEPETIRRAAAFYDRLPEHVSREATALRARNAGLVLSDAPPLACAAAAAAGVPSVLVSNFTWDWIYEGYRPHIDLAPQLLPAIRAAYRQAAAAWRLPMHGGFATFERSQILDVPLVARHADHERLAVCRALDLPARRRLVLLSFGGLGVRDIDLAQVDCLDSYDLVLTSHEARDVLNAGRPGVHVVQEPALSRSGLRYEDLVAAVDVVLTKPGYGTIAECIANDTAMLYTSRGRFAEYDALVAALPRVLRSRFIDQEALFTGRWRDDLDALLAQPPPAERPASNGAEVVAKLIQQVLEGRGPADVTP